MCRQVYFEGECICPAFVKLMTWFVCTAPAHIYNGNEWKLCYTINLSIRPGCVFKNSYLLSKMGVSSLDVVISWAVMYLVPR